MDKEIGTYAVKKGLAQMLKGGVIMDVVTAEHAKIAEEQLRDYKEMVSHNGDAWNADVLFELERRLYFAMVAEHKAQLKDECKCVLPSHTCYACDLLAEYRRSER